MGEKSHQSNFYKIPSVKQAQANKQGPSFSPLKPITHSTISPLPCRGLRNCPTGPFTILKPEDQEIDEFCVVRESRATDLEAPKLWKGRSGGRIWTTHSIMSNMCMWSPPSLIRTIGSFYSSKLSLHKYFRTRVANNQTLIIAWLSSMSLRMHGG